MANIQTIKQEMQDVLHENILRFWLDNMQDEERGGFYGQMTGDGRIVKDAPKGGILNARILWSFSAAFRVTGREEYLMAAIRAKDYILDHFFDPEYGGTYWSLNADGTPLDTKKQFYALGFMLYGLSEYVRATGDIGALPACIALYNIIEEHSWEPQFGGYIEACNRDWSPIADMRLSDKDANYPKSQNTHLHIIEPYTNLYRVWPDRGLAKSLRRLIDIFCERILNPETHHLDLFFDNDWTRGAGHLESYGHDIECSWLMHEAALVLGQKKVIARVEPIVRLVAEASEKGLNPDGSMTHEANLDTGHVDADRHWWVQAETVVGFANIYQHFADESALDKASRCWEYIKDNLIDREGGEWWWSVAPPPALPEGEGAAELLKGRTNRTDDKAGFWKCPYHNSRMCLEIIERF